MWSLAPFRLLVDKFHLQGHICGFGFDAIGCPEASGVRSSSAESLNALIASVKASVR